MVHPQLQRAEPIYMLEISMFTMSFTAHTGTSKTETNTMNKKVKIG
jgi:hypothetical protein